MRFTPDEKMDILSIIRTWDRLQHSQDSLNDIQRQIGIPARLAEITFWHYDTLYALSKAQWLFFKGGTSVQTYLEPGLQRSSVDLDFNTDIENPNSILAEMDTINRDIEKNGASCTAQEFEFGKIEYLGEDPHTLTMNFQRRMPSRFGEMELVKDQRIQTKSVRLQISRKNVKLPAFRTVKKQPYFFIQKYQTPKKVFEIIHLSKEDLIADKILASCNVEGFGRERFKDIYDLGFLLRAEFESEIVMKKLDIITENSAHILKGTLNTASSFSERTVQARGFLGMVATEGRNIAWDWEGFCFDLMKGLKDLIKE